MCCFATCDITKVTCYMRVHLVQNTQAKGMKLYAATIQQWIRDAICFLVKLASESSAAQLNNHFSHTLNDSPKWSALLQPSHIHTDPSQVEVPPRRMIPLSVTDAAAHSPSSRNATTRALAYEVWVMLPTQVMSEVCCIHS
jgi:hypothetical protein